MGRGMIVVLSKLGLCLMPMALTPVWAYLISDGYLDFGSGEKDLFPLIPWIVWSFLYLIIFIIGWVKRLKIKHILMYWIGGATGILTIAWIVLYFWFNNILGVYKG